MDRAYRLSMVKSFCRWQTFVLVMWILMLGSGLRVLWAYETTPGTQLSKSTHLHHGQISLAPHKLTLVMFAHPHCPCTKASLLELQQLENNLHGLLNIKVFFIQPASKDSDWVHSPLWDFARSIPDAEASVDHLGVLAKELNAQVSGETFLYSPTGELLFTGGITPSRGHVGENVGRTAIDDLTTVGRTKYSRTRVYGCSLFNNEEGSSTWK